MMRSPPLDNSKSGPLGLCGQSSSESLPKEFLFTDEEDCVVPKALESPNSLLVAVFYTF